MWSPDGPRSSFLGKLLNGDLDFLFLARVARPDHAKARPVLFVLNSNQIARPEGLFHACNERALAADIAGESTLREAHALGIKAPNQDLQAAFDARLSPAFNCRVLIAVQCSS